MAPKSQRRSRRRNNRPAPQQSFIDTGSVSVASIFAGNSFAVNVFPLVPTIVPGSRLAQLALTFSQFNIISSTVSYVAQAASNIDGRFVMAYAFDTRENPPTSLNQIVQTSRSVYGPLWRNHNARLPRRSSEKRRYAVIGRDDLLALSPEDQQQFVPAVCLFANGESSATSRVGNLIWHYKIQFFNPLSPEADTPSTSRKGLIGGLVMGMRRLQLDSGSKIEEAGEDTQAVAKPPRSKAVPPVAESGSYYYQGR